MESQEQEMPYAGEIRTAYEIVEIVGKEQRISVSELYPQVNAKHNPTKSHSKRIAEFLGLIRTIGSNVEITDLGRIFVAHRSPAERNKLLAQSLPKKYTILLRWIKNAKDNTMTLTDLKTLLVQNNIERKPNSRAYDWILQMFGNFADSIGVISYLKGKTSRFQITDFGKSVLDGTSSNSMPSVQVQEREQSVRQLQKPTQANLEGEYPVLIVTRDRKPLDIDIHDEVDWDIVDSYIKSLKSGWKKSRDVPKRNPAYTSYATEEENGE